MKRWTQTMLGIGLAVTIVACDNRADENAARPDSGAPVGTAGAGSNADRDFIQDQLEDGHAEVMLGQVAAERASHPQVKEFAQMMVREHQTAGEELRQLATAASVQVTPPAQDLDGDHKDLHEELAKLSGLEFDRKYMDAMVEEHEEAVNEVEKKAESENAEVRRWAAKTLPKLRQHLEQAKQLKETLENAGTR